MGSPWLIIGVSGVTCGGKTTLTAELNKVFPRSKVISQDDYFLPVEDPRHTWIVELNHINFELPTALDMDRIVQDIKTIIGNRQLVNLNGKNHVDTRTLSRADLQRVANQKMKVSPINLLIVEGFSILNYKPIEELCDLKYYFTLNKDECYKRRLTRVYEPPDCPGYFEKCVWPEHLKQLDYVEKNVSNLRWFTQQVEDPLCEVLSDIINIL